MKLLITGASGFVGSAVFAYFSDKANFDPVGVYRTKQVDIPISSQVIVSEITPTTNWLESLAGVELVIHLAGRAHILNESSVVPLDEFRKTNMYATINLAKQARVVGVKRFLFISSIGVNGSFTTGAPFTESSVAAPHADYALSKWEAESELWKIFEGSATELVIIRPPLVYSVDAPGNFARLLNIVGKGVPLPFSLVDNQRSMIALQNLVHFIFLCASHPNAANELFLVADDQNLSTPNIVKLLSKGMQRRVILFPIPDKIMRGAARFFGKEAIYKQLCCSLVIDASKARRLLNWAPTVAASSALVESGKMHRKSKIKNISDI